jgi:mannose-6-phosphate isomerase
LSSLAKVLHANTNRMVHQVQQRATENKMPAQLLTIPSRKEPRASKTLLYPLRVAPIFEYRPWGGRRLGDLLNKALPAGPIGEAWALSDREDHASPVTNGNLKGQYLGHVFEQFPEQLMGSLAHRFPRFPLLLKFLDARQMLSVQVHPSGDTGKSEGWVVLETGKDSRICAGLESGTTSAELVQSLAAGTVTERLRFSNPKVGDAYLVPAGTVHTLGDVVVFEIQQNSDVTFRLHDWDHIDTKTGQPRPLQIPQALACINFAETSAGLVTPIVETTAHVRRELVFKCDHFWLWRLRAQSPFTVGAEGLPRVVVCIDGFGQILHGGVTHAIGKGDVFLLPAEIGVCAFQPRGGVILLEMAIPCAATREQS